MSDDLKLVKIQAIKMQLKNSYLSLAEMTNDIKSENI